MMALLPLTVSQALAQNGGCGIVSYSSPSTPGYEQGGGPSGFNVGDLPDYVPDEEFGLPGVVVEIPEQPGSNSIAYGSCIYTDTIDVPTSCYEADDSGALHQMPAEDCDG